MKSSLEFVTEDIPKIDKDTNKEDMAEIDKDTNKEDIPKEDISKEDIPKRILLIMKMK